MTGIAQLPDQAVIEAEQALLGALLQKPDLVDDLAIDWQDFYKREDRLIAKVVIALHSRGDAVDTITAIDELRARNELDAAGGAVYVGGLARNVVTANARSYANRVKTSATERRLFACVPTIIDLANDHARPIDERLAEASQALDAVTPECAGSGPRQVNEYVPTVLDDLDARSQAGGRLPGLSTGFADLDHHLAGMHAGELIIVAGRPSMGKTALALNIAQSVALDEHQPVAFFSLEMLGGQLVERMVCAMRRVDAQRLRIGNLHDDEWPKVVAATGELKDAPLFIDESAGLHVNELCRRARRLHREHRLRLIVVDYLQLLHADKEQRKDLEIAAISAALKALAKELRVPVVALSQLNRSLEQRNNKRPTMSDLRESGAIEQDADVIAFVYRDEVYNEDSAARGTAEIIISKQRSGPTGTVRLTFAPHFQRFENFIGAAPGYRGGYDCAGSRLGYGQE